MNKKSWYVLRIVVGLYLTYLGIKLITGVMAERPGNMVFVLFMAGIFIVIGVLYAVSAIKKVLALKNEESEEDLDGVEDDSYEDESDDSEETKFIDENETAAYSESENVEDNDIKEDD
ncbi:hypothetical protein HGO97_006755 [Faecalicatena sp. AGMB00832]|uniref:Uncharacterized protein n=1 Tax=Faecalicatena faecalis TaxID=2726362 RepID=A0ABS6D1P1_9FIRM|nr:hypothetical protein [Faecalicatena faecalis]MBU3875509.1 hypothetical protein [Faecalicatena faecalis]